MYPVRDTSTRTPPIRPLATRKYFSVSSFRSDAALSTRADVGPCSASAATSSDTSSTVTRSPEAFCRNQRRARIGRRPPEQVVVEPRHRAIVDDLTVFVAPRRVEHLADGHFRDVPGNQAIDQAGGVRTRNQVFEQRRDVDERRRIANRVVLVFVMALVRADRVVARPLAVVQALAEGERAVVHGGANGHGGNIAILNAEC